MAKWLSVFAVVLLFGTLATTAVAQTGEGDGATAAESGTGAAISLSAVGAGMVMIGLGLGIGRIGGSATESIARQPEFGAQIQTAMIISAALIEGAGLFGLIICLL